MADHSLTLLEELFERAAALAAKERQSFLDAQCQGQPSLRIAVEELLQSDALLGPDDGFLRGPINGARAAANDSALALKIHGYRVHAKIGDGGMGAVYEAEQENPRRRVAIKVIRPGMASRDMIKRFRLEAQVLGRLRHPGIAQIYEAGVSENGQPYIAMEFVSGLALLEYASKKALDVEARIELVTRVCDAVQHAHNHGIIHRDLKPANILVDEAGQPRVLDFGVARAADIDLQTTTAHTQAGQLIGTLTYMSPEQMAADPAGIDHRTDVYALGVILFELLAERPPFDFQNVPLPEVARVICEREPPALGTVSPVFRGAVETIVAKALEKRAHKRYLSALELASDLRRYLAKEPIQAQRTSNVERLWHWSRQNRGVAASLAIIACLVAAVAIGSTMAALWFQESSSRNAKLAQDREEARERAEQASKSERWQRYRANIASAANALQLHNISAAKSALDAAPAEHRNWEWFHFHSQLDSSGRVLHAPIPLERVVLSPDDSRAAAFDVTVDARNSLVPDVFVWDMTTGNHLHALTGGTDAVISTISPDCEQAAFGTNEGLVRLLDLTTGKETAVLQAHAGKVTALAFSPNSQHLVSGGADRSVRLWDVITAQEVVAFVDLDGAAQRLVLSRDGKRLLTATDTIRLWDLERQQSVDMPGFKSWWRFPIGFSPDDRWVLIGRDYPHNDVQVCDAATGRVRSELSGHQNSIFDVACSPDGSRIAAASMDQTVRIWDGNTGQPIAVLRGHTDWVLSVSFSPNGERLVSAGNDGTLRVWDAAAGELIDVFLGHLSGVNGVVWCNGGKQLASASSDRTLRLWDLPVVAGRGVLSGHQNFVYDVACSPNGGQLASAAWDGTVRLWDLAKAQETAVLQHENEEVTSVAYAPGGKQLVSVTRGDRIVLWDLVTRRTRHTFRAPTGMGGVDSRAVFDPQGSRVAVGTYDGFVRMWDVQSGADAGAFAAGAGLLHDVAFSPDGVRVACAGSEGLISIWNVERQELVSTLRGHSNHVQRVVFSQDGLRLASAGEDRTARVWNAETGQELLPPLAHNHTVFGLSFSPDGTRLATSCGDNTVRLWDLANGQEVAELRGHRGYVKAVTFSPDGTQLFSGSGDQTVRVWDTLGT